MPGPHSGKYGVIDGLTDILNWSDTEESTPVESVTSATRGGRRRSSGTLDGSVSFAGKGGIPPVKPFVRHNFKGYSAPDDDVYGSNGVTKDGFIYATSIVVNMNWEGNEDVNYSIDGACDGLLTIGSGFYEDPGPPLEASICPCKIEYGDLGLEVEIEHIASATLTFTIDMVEYMNSSTNCEMERKPGPIDWSLDINLHDNVRPVPIQSDERLKVWISATQYFVLEFGHLASYSDFNVDIEGNSIVGQTMNWGMQAFKQSDLTTIGAIYWPDDAVNPIWPPTAPTVVSTVKGKNDAPALAT